MVQSLNRYLPKGPSTDSDEIAPGIVLDLDEHNRVIGVEMEDANKLMDLTQRASANAFGTKEHEGHEEKQRN